MSEANKQAGEPERFRVSVEDGRWCVVQCGDRCYAEQHGQPVCDLTKDGLVMALATELAGVREELADLREELRHASMERDTLE